MLIIKIELHDANTGKVTELAHARIVNDGTQSDGSGDAPLGNYDALFYARGALRAAILGADHARFVEVGNSRVTDWPRNRSAWRLLLAALKAAFPDSMAELDAEQRLTKMTGHVQRLEAKYIALLKAASDAHERLGYPSHDNVEAALRSLAPFFPDGD